MRLVERGSLRAGLGLAGLVVMMMLASGVGAVPAFGEMEVPWWHVNAYSRPSYLKPGGEGVVVVGLTNLGDAGANGGVAPVVVRDTLPEGVSASSASFFVGNNNFFNNLGEGSCSINGRVVVCEFAGFMPPYSRLETKINVKLEPSVKPGVLQDAVSVSGGAAAGVSVSDPLTVSEASTPFGVQAFELTPENADGSIDTQAGSHPFQLTSTLVLNQGPETEKRPPEMVGFVLPVALPKDLHAALPPGLIGNPKPFPQCSEELVFKEECPADTQVGIAVVTVSEPLHTTFPRGIYNVSPAPGEPARFGFQAVGITTFLDTSVRAGGDYGVTVNSDNITQTGTFLGAQLTFWGVPGDQRHDRSRGPLCLSASTEVSPSECSASTVTAPFLALPTSCGNPVSEPFEASIEGDSWPTPGKPSQQASMVKYKLHNALEPSIALDGCNQLAFEPSIKATPDDTAASSPTGLTVDVHVPQQEVLVPKGDAESAVRDITVALPEGVAINPAGGDGLQACSEGLVGYTGVGEVDPGLSAQTFTPKLSEPFCPNASKIGEVTIHTPLLANPVRGFVYIASQNENPFGSLVALYIVAEDPVSGTVVKLAGEVRLSETGQIVTYIRNSPQLPFEDAELHFFGGERAPLATPAHCGSYTTSASFTPWSGIKPVGSTSSFPIKTGPSDSPCPGASLPFSPSLTGGTINNNGGAFSALSTTIGREDGQQNMSSVSLHMPPGLSGLLSGVELCPEANANAGSCAANSLIGETTVSAGVGPDPVSVKGGKVYITGPYHGEPFGLSIVNPVKAGPLDLEHDTSNPNQNPACDCVVVRAKIEVDPHTAALTVTTNNENEGYAIPHLIDGIPVQIKKVNVLIDRPGFTFNPTSCDPMQITGSIGSDEGASSPVSVPFQVANCAILKFAPKFSVSTSAKTSKADGASLVTKLSEPAEPQGSQADIARVKVELPEALPSRLTTLQKACTGAQFEANPAGCPPESNIGHAVVHTPLIPVPLEGPAIFVSHGGEAFPSLTMVLQGYGLTVDLVGTTFISKSGVTSTTFKTVPDVPFNTFELTLPEGPYSALTANGDLCSQRLAMPTEFIAQNGAEIHRSTPIAVAGCAPKIRVVGHSVKGETATIEVSVPSAGRLVASAGGMSGASVKAGRASTLTLKLHLSKRERSFLAKHRGRKLKAKITLRFTPRKGGALKTTTTVLIG
jgi:hypothetical protein